MYWSKEVYPKQMIVFDRYYYDYFVDMKRYRYSLPQWFPHLFAWSIPTPDIIFILDGTPEVLYQRKKNCRLTKYQGKDLHI